MRTHAVPIAVSANGSSDEGDADQGDAHPSAARILLPVEELLHAGSSYARSLTRSPRSPEGRKISTAISTRNANTSW